MKINDLERACEIAKTAALEAGEELIRHFGNVEAEVKSSTGHEVTDVVTKLDRQTERLLSTRLAAFDPAIGFRGEEFGVQRQSDTTWLVDPIDGTSHFVRGIPFCTTMIALIEDGVVMMAVINDFVRKDIYWAIRGKGAYRNEERIQVSSRTLKQGLLSFETNLDKPGNIDLYLRVRNETGIINTINCGFEFAMVASGKLDGRLTKDPYGYDWDFAPGSLLVQEAGGVVTNHGTDTYHYKNHDFIATNQLIHSELTSGKDTIFPSSS